MLKRMFNGFKWKLGQAKDKYLKCTQKSKNSHIVLKCLESLDEDLKNKNLHIYTHTHTCGQKLNYQNNS